MSNYGKGTMRLGYKVIRVNGKQIFEHRHVMEKYLGRKLKPDEHVHHIDYDKLNNDISNLRLMSNSDHRRIHRHDKRQYQEKLCPRCGACMNPLGRPKKIDDAKALELKNKGMSLREIAKELGVTHGSVQSALRRMKL